MVARTCSFLKENGEQCQAAPMREGEFCFLHSPDHVQEAAEARRMGGLRRRREKITGGAYEFDGLGDTGSIRRLIEIAVLDTLGLETSIARSRTLAYLAQVALRALQAGELEERVQSLEHAMRPRLLTKGGKR